MLRPPGTPARARRDVEHPGLEAGGTPQKREKELAALQKSWTNFSGDDGCGRGKWDWGVAPTPPAPGRRREPSAGADPSTPLSAPPGLDSRFVESLKRIRPPGTHKNAPRNLNPSPF